MTTTINSNGSKFLGQEPDCIDDLLRVLAETPLNRLFEAYGNFIQFEPELCDGTKLDGITNFSGNFFKRSHVFDIDTDDADAIEKLTAAITANQQRADYLNQQAPEQVSEQPAEPVQMDMLELV